MVVQSGPRLMAGIPASYLSPLLPPPTDIVAPVGIEIEPGLGISVDGRALLVGYKDGPEHVDIVGHLSDGTYPQRDYKVDRQGGQTSVDGLYSWQDYKLTRQGADVKVDNEDPRNSFVFHNLSDGFETQNQYVGRHYSVHGQGSSATVKSAWDQDQGFLVTQNGNQTQVKDNGYEDGDFTVTRGQDGKIDVKGKYLFNNFTLIPTASGWDIQGYYPQQHFLINRS